MYKYSLKKMAIILMMGIYKRRLTWSVSEFDGDRRVANKLDNKQSRYTRDQKKRRVSVVSCISRPGCIERVTQLKLLGVFIDSTFIMECTYWLYCEKSY